MDFLLWLHTQRPESQGKWSRRHWRPIVTLIRRCIVSLAALSVHLLDELSIICRSLHELLNCNINLQGNISSVLRGPGQPYNYVQNEQRSYFLRALCAEWWVTIRCRAYLIEEEGSHVSPGWSVIRLNPSSSLTPIDMCILRRKSYHTPRIENDGRLWTIKSSIVTV